MSRPDRVARPVIHLEEPEARRIRAVADQLELLASLTADAARARTGPAGLALPAEITVHADGLYAALERLAEDLRGALETAEGCGP